MEHHTNIKQWKRDELQFCRFPTYDLIYAHYYRYKFPSWGLKNRTLIAEGVVLNGSSNNNNNNFFSDQPLNLPKLCKIISFQSFVSLFSMILLCFTQIDDQATMANNNNNNNNYPDNDDDGIIDDEDQKLNRKYFKTKFISVPHFGPTTIRKSLNTFMVQHRFSLTACVKLISFSIILFSLWTDKISWNWSKRLLQKSRALSNRHEFHVHEYYCIFWWRPSLFVDHTSHLWLVFTMMQFVLHLLLLPLHCTICSLNSRKAIYVLQTHR